MRKGMADAVRFYRHLELRAGTFYVTNEQGLLEDMYGKQAA
jgi:hypothetical protein